LKKIEIALKSKHIGMLILSIGLLCSASSTYAQEKHKNPLGRFVDRLFKKKAAPEELPQQSTKSLSTKELRKALETGKVSLANLDLEEIKEKLYEIGFISTAEIKAASSFGLAKSRDTKNGHIKLIGGGDSNQSIQFFCETDYIDTLSEQQLVSESFDMTSKCIALANVDSQFWAIELNSRLDKDRQLPEAETTTAPTAADKELVKRNEITTSTRTSLLTQAEQVEAAAIQHGKTHASPENAPQTLEKITSLVDSASKRNSSKPKEVTKKITRNEMFQMLQYLRKEGQILPELGLGTLAQLRNLKGSVTSRNQSPTVQQALEVYFQDGAGFHNSTPAFQLAKGELDEMIVPEFEIVPDKNSKTGYRQATAQELFYPFVESALETIANTPYFTEELMEEGIQESEEDSLKFNASYKTKQGGA